MTEPEFDIAAPSDFNMTFTTTAAMLEVFDKGVEMARKALTNTSDDDMKVDWTFRHGDHVIFSRPRSVVLRSAVLSHIIHLATSTSEQTASTE
jgi:hypothetical protein